MEYLLQIRAENVLIQQVIGLFLFFNMDVMVHLEYSTRLLDFSL